MKIMLVCLVSMVISMTTATAAPAQKNILFLLTDDGGFELGPYNNTMTETTHISALAAKGVTFDAAYTAVSSCSPSRSAILSGLPTHQNGMYGLSQYPGNFQSNTDITSLPNVLNAAGYKTGILGKYHVNPEPNYGFQYGLGHGAGCHGATCPCWAGCAACTSSLPWSDVNGYDENYNQVTRNLTKMKLAAREFLNDIEPDKPFFLYVGFGDSHRCKYDDPYHGTFCEKWGDGGASGTIPDWTPKVFDPAKVPVPTWLPDTPETRRDIAAMYGAVNRMDQGVGVLVGEVERAGKLDSTLIVYFADNGIPYPSGKTNLHTQQGMGEPLVISAPGAPASLHGTRSGAVVSSLDFVPTILDWAGVAWPNSATAHHHKATLTGASLLPFVLGGEQRKEAQWRNAAYASHQFHSLYAYYPMRAVVAPVNGTRYRLVRNLNYDLQFAILEDVYGTDTWAAIQAAGEAGKPDGWIYTWDEYMRRPEWQLFDADADPYSLHNLAATPGAAAPLAALQGQLAQWRQVTHDPWAKCNTAATGHECSI